jgi:hypothetical protein
MNTFKEPNLTALSQKFIRDQQTTDASTVSEAKIWYKRFTDNKGDASENEIVELYKMLKKTVDK